MSGQARGRAGLSAVLAVALGAGCLHTVSTPLLDGGGCLLGATPVLKGTLDPRNSCRSCQPALSATSLSPVEDGTHCGDGGAGFCHQGACSVGCFIGGRFHFVGDRGGVCQACDPGLASNGWSPFSGFPLSDECAAGQVCSTGACAAACFLDGILVDAGTVDPANTCQTCQPKVATAAWSAATRGSPCGDGGQCNGSTCELGCQIRDTLYPAGTPEPGASCWSCQPERSWLGWSAISGVPPYGCDGGDVCDQGDCKPGCWIDGGYLASGVTPAAQPCRICSPALNLTDFTPLSGDALGACGPGAVCDVGACQRGCSIAGSIQAPGAFQLGNPALCCGPSNSTSDWSPVFTQGASYAAGFGQVLVAGDIDGDGFTDLVVGGVGAGSNLQVFFGDGDGGLRTPVPFPFELAYYGGGGMSVADVDGDGAAEIVAGLVVDGGSAIGVGAWRDGGMTLALSIPVDAVWALALGDFNGDGLLDVAFLDGYQGVQVLMNADGGLVPGPLLTIAGLGWPLAAADFDGDGNIDLALGSSYGPAFWLGDGGGGFPSSFRGPQTNIEPSCLAAQDLGGNNGRADLVVGPSDDYLLQVASVVGPDTAQLTSYPMPELSSVALGDLNGDGLPDLIASDDYRSGKGLELMINSPGGFVSSASLPLDTSGALAAVLAVVVGRFEPDAGLGLGVLTEDHQGGVSVTLYRSGCR